MHKQEILQSGIRLVGGVQDLLVCPICKNKLKLLNEGLLCADSNCGALFPFVNGIPILLNEQSSLFSIDDFLAQRRTTFNLRESKFKKTARRVVPSISKNIKGESNNRKFVELLLAQSSAPTVLVIGAGPSGAGMEFLSPYPSIEQVVTDVSFGSGIGLICDAHDIPFADGSFDAVIVHAVLEHVVDPHRCVEEIHRVLKKQGVVYADTPFMQQVHGRQYDFERFTYLGHRRLFRRFEEVDSGASCGPGMALAWAYSYFLMSFTETKLLRHLIWAFSSMTSFYLKYFDHLLIDKPGTLDAASGYYFIGRKSDSVLSDRELVNLYKGAI